ncbi:MAG: HIT family protein [Planctomycetota bacterium]
MACVFCDGPGGEVLWQSASLRIVAADEADAPGLCRVVLRQHVCEMTDLPAIERDAIMRAVFALESALRAVCVPDKMNVASLGNVTPHLHWHVIPRWRNDSRFPDPIWCPPRRESPGRAFGRDERARIAAALTRELGPSSPLPRA